jgi:hypothetical protein
MASLLALGTLGSVGTAKAADEMGSPQCQAAQDENGQDVLTCDNLTEEQSLSMLQSPDAYRRCFRTCAFRAGPLCIGYRVRCYNYGRRWHCGYNWRHRWTCGWR